MKPLLLILAACGVLSAQPPVVLEASSARQVIALEGKTHHVQGIDTDGDHLWVTAVDRPTAKGFLYEYSLRDGKLLRSLEVQQGDRYHPGGIATDETSIWIPIAEYKASSSATIQRRNKKTLEVEFEFSVPDHIGCVAVTPEYIIGGNWDSRDFYLWDHQGKLIRKVASRTGNSYQDIKVREGKIVASGTIPGGSGAVDWLDLLTVSLLKRVSVGSTNSGASLAREGMTIFEAQLLFVPEDDMSRLFSIPLP
jgi:hypothetical protein